MNPYRFLVPLLTCAAMLIGGPAAARDYQFDRVHSQVSFEVSHLGFSMSQGRFKGLSGGFSFSPRHWERASCDVHIDVASLDMGDAGWRKKLLSEDWFNVERYPEMRFVCTQLEKIDEKRGILRGDLTLLGVTQPVKLDLTFNRAGMHKYALQHVAGFSASTRILRSTFGMDRTIPDIGDEITIRIQIEGTRRKKP
jgi:polyisoprenoid-binding protein YceI